MKKGMTMVEVLVSLVVLSFVLGAIFTILNIQTVRAGQVQKTSIMQTDAQIALTLLKWDLATSGLGYPKQNDAVVDGDGGAAGPDSIRMRSVGLGFEANETKWTWLLDEASGQNFVVRKMMPDAPDLEDGDLIVALDASRKPLDPPGDMIVSGAPVDTLFIDPVGDTIPALSVTVNVSLKAIAGLVIIAKVPGAYTPGITYWVNTATNQLMRDNEIMLDNVEDLQLAYGFDTDGDEVIDLWQDRIAPFASPGRKWAIRYTLVVTSKPMAAYRYPANVINVENHSYNVPPGSILQRQKRAILSGVIAPQNLQP